MMIIYYILGACSLFIILPYLMWFASAIRGKRIFKGMPKWFRKFFGTEARKKKKQETKYSANGQSDNPYSSGRTYERQDRSRDRQEYRERNQNQQRRSSRGRTQEHTRFLRAFNDYFEPGRGKFFAENSSLCERFYQAFYDAILELEDVSSYKKINTWVRKNIHPDPLENHNQFSVSELTILFSYYNSHFPSK